MASLQDHRELSTAVSSISGTMYFTEATMSSVQMCCLLYADMLGLMYRASYAPPIGTVSSIEVHRELHTGAPVRFTQAYYELHRGVP